MNENEKQLLEKYWDESHEQQLEKMLSENGELRKVFEAHPDRKLLYKLKIINSEHESGGGKITTHKWCDTCIFCGVIEPIGRQPQSRYCKIYGATNSPGKPDEVIYEGEICEYYEKEKRKK